MAITFCSYWQQATTGYPHMGASGSTPTCGFFALCLYMWRLDVCPPDSSLSFWFITVHTVEEVKVSTVIFVCTGCTDTVPAASASAADTEGIRTALSTSAARNEGPHAAARARGSKTSFAHRLFSHRPPRVSASSAYQPRGAAEHPSSCSLCPKSWSACFFFHRTSSRRGSVSARSLLHHPLRSLPPSHFATKGPVPQH